LKEALMKVEPDGLSRRRVLTLLLPVGLGVAAIAWGDWLPLPRLAEGVGKGEKKKEEDDEDEKEDKGKRRRKGDRK